MANTGGPEVGVAYVTVMPDMSKFSQAVGREMKSGAGTGITNTLNNTFSRAGASGANNFLGSFFSEAGINDHGFSDRFGEAMSSFTSKAKTAAKAAGAAFVAGFVAVAKQSFDEAADYEQYKGGVEKIFEGAASTVIDNANGAYKSMGVSVNDYMNQVTMFSAALKQSLGGDVYTAAKQADIAMGDMADNASVYGTNLIDIQNAYQGFAKQNYTMLDNLRLGYGGTKKEMERLIADANAWGAANGQASDLTIDSYSDVITAIHQIQEATNIYGNASEEASDTVSGSIQSMQAAWKNWLNALANPDGELGIDQASKNLVESLKNVIKNGAPVIQTIAEEFGKALPSIVDAIIPYIPGIVEPIVNALMKSFFDIVAHYPAVGLITALGVFFKGAGIADSILTFFTGQGLGARIGAALGTAMKGGIAASAAGAGAEGGVGALLGVAAIPKVVLLIGLVAALTAGLVYFLTQTEQGKAILQGFHDFAVNAFNAIGAGINTVGTVIGGVVSGVLNTLLAIGVPLVNIVIGIGGLIWMAIDTVIIQPLKTFFDWIGQGVSAMWTVIQPYVTVIATAIGNFVTQAMNVLNSFFTWIGSGISQVAAWAGGIFSPVIDAINNFISWAGGKISGFFDGIRQWWADLMASFHIPQIHVEGSFNLTPGHFSVPKLSLYANGGIVTAPTLSLVGEAGYDEAVVPLNQAKLLPFAKSVVNQMNETGTGGGDVNVNVNIETVVIRDADADARKLGERIGDEAALTLKSRGVAA